MGVKVAAVVVTYNRLEKLKKVLAALERQTRRPDALVLLDNASTDGTREFLDAYQGPFDRIDVTHLSVNTGGAGGFSAGMNRGYALGADFVWVMDDDGYPEPEALERLEAGYQAAVQVSGPNVPFACSMVKFIDGTICEMNNPVPTWDWGRALALGVNVVTVERCSFVSVLIPRWVLEMYGLPYKEYFIWFDDAEYTTRISRTCPGVQVLDSVVIHDMGRNKGVNFGMIDEHNAWKFRHGIRNEASYHLHHEGRAEYLLFCATVERQMRRGGVDPRLRVQMTKELLAAVRFNPVIDYPTPSAEVAELGA
ncbi:glycosyltransferase family 2 protein [Pseudoclavibacter caeni]|nr:glycosyltransferase family 2 protein [Pseudoclavibacter caeni]NYJ96356.1 GT2 family glycosyltransferase [Pseudoclavibacter caeni]